MRRKKGFTRGQVLAIAILAFAVWGWVDVRVRGTVDPQDPGLHKTDLTVYTEAGAAFFDGRNPYHVTNVRGWGYLYPPLFAIVLAPLHHLPPRAQVLVWFAVSLLLAWGCYRECVRIGRAVWPGQREPGAFGPLPDWIGWAAVAAATLSALNCLQRGQVGILKLYLLVLGFRLLVESRAKFASFLAGCTLALPIVVKVTPIVPVGFVVLQQWIAAWHAPARRPAVAQAGALTLGVAAGLACWLFIVPGVLVGWRANLGHLETWWSTVAVRAESTVDDFAGDSSSKRNQSFVNAARQLGNWTGYWLAGSPNPNGPARLHEGGPGLPMEKPVVEWSLLAIRLAAAGLLLGVVVRTATADDKLRQAAGFGLACVATLTMAPIARGHYFVLLFPAVLFVSGWLLAHDRRRVAAWFAWAPVGLVLAHYLLLDIAGSMGVLGLGTMAWYVAAACVLTRREPASSFATRELGRNHARSGSIAA